MDSVASGLCFNGNLPTLQIRKDALKQQCAFTPSILIYDSHYSLGPAEDLEKVFSGTEGENSIFSLWRPPTSSVDVMENIKDLFHAALRDAYEPLKYQWVKTKGQSFNRENLKSLCKFCHVTFKAYCIKKLFWEGALCIIHNCFWHLHSY